MCAFSKIFHIKGSDLQYVSQMCNITPLEVEISIRRRKFHRKLFDLVGDIAVGVVFHSLSASVYLLRFYFFSFFFCVRLCCCLYEKLSLYIKVTGCHLPYEITCYLPSDTSEHTPPLLQPETGTRFTYPRGIEG